MNRLLLGMLLFSGLACSLACLGTKDKDEEPAEEVQAEPEAEPGNQQPAVVIDERHRPLSERVQDDAVEIKSMERVGSKEGATTAAEEFVHRFMRLKYNARGIYESPIMKYFPQTEEWSAMGVLQGKDPRMPRYTVECLVHLNNDNEWECRLIRVDKRQVYAMDNPDPDVTLPNLRADEEGNPSGVVAESPHPEDGDTNDAGEAGSEEKPADLEAEGELRMAKTLINRAPAKARQRLQEIIDKYPDSDAAEEARDLMKTIKE